MVDEIGKRATAAAATLTLGGASPGRGQRVVWAERYVDEGPLGEGGMGEVRRVWDRHLERPVAMKIIHSARLEKADARQRFLAEARLTAGLQHPGIVAVHDLGTLDDGRLWFTMREVRGRTLAALLEDRDLGFRRLVEILARVCAIVGYAHERGIIHRDIKPGNLMVGEFGEVHVVDWGISAFVSNRPVVQVAGTPAYLSPEQARGGVLGPATDVYALGVVLREVITGVLPADGSITQMIKQVALGPPPPLTGLAADRVELGAIAERAMAANPADRFMNAAHMGRAIEAWLDGAQQAERGRALVAEAMAELPAIFDLHVRADELRSQAATLLVGVPSYAPDDQKAPAWALEDAAEGLDHEAAALEAAMLQRLHAALMLSPDLLEAHELLADHHRTQVERAEARGDGQGAALHTQLVRSHARSERHQAWLLGRGLLSLPIETPGSRVAIYANPERDRRKALEFKGYLSGPIHEHALRAGTWLLHISAPGHAEIRYPVRVERGGHTRSVPPAADAPLPVRLPPAAQVEAEDCVVPAGWFLAGGDASASDSTPRRRLWVDDFVIRRHPVTVGEYRTYLEDLLARGQVAEAEERAPRDRSGPRLLVRRDHGYELLDVGADWPIALVSWHDATAYCAWMAARTGRPWRLPHDLEWEKAARGVDGRIWPWGDHAEPTWARVHGCSPEVPGPAPVEQYPLDESLYGVRGLVGNVRDWCSNTYRRAAPEEGSRVDGQAAGEGDMRFIRGGSWATALTQCRPAGRYAGAPDARYLPVGFRLARSL